MKFKRKIAGLLTAVMAFSGLATFSVAADVVPVDALSSTPEVISAIRLTNANSDLGTALGILDAIIAGPFANPAPTRTTVPSAAAAYAEIWGELEGIMSALYRARNETLVSRPLISAELSSILSSLQALYNVPPTASPTNIPGLGTAGPLFNVANPATVPAQRIAELEIIRTVLTSAASRIGAIDVTEAGGMMVLGELSTANAHMLNLFDGGLFQTDRFVVNYNVYNAELSTAGRLAIVNALLAPTAPTSARTHIQSAQDAITTVMADAGPTLAGLLGLVDLATAQALLTAASTQIPAGATAINYQTFNTARTNVINARAFLVAARAILAGALDYLDTDIPPGPRFYVPGNQSVNFTMGTPMANQQITVNLVDFVDYYGVPITPTAGMFTVTGPAGMTMPAPTITNVTASSVTLVFNGTPTRAPAMLPGDYTFAVGINTPAGVPDAHVLEDHSATFTLNVDPTPMARRIIRPNVPSIFGPLNSFRAGEILMDPAALVPAADPNFHAPMLVVPVRDLDRSGGELRITLPWAALATAQAWQTGFNLARDNGFIPLNTTDTDVNAVSRAVVDWRLPISGQEGWYQVSDGRWHYSGKQGGAVAGVGGVFGTPTAANEIPFVAILSGNQMTIIYPNTQGITDDSVLRVPLLVGAGSATQRDTLRRVNVEGFTTPAGAEVPETPMEIIVGGANVNWPSQTAVTGRTALSLNPIRINEPLGAAQSLRPGNNHIVLTLNPGHRWDNSPIYTTGLFPNAHVFIPATDAFGNVRDGETAPSIMVIQLGARNNTDFLPHQSGHMYIRGLRVIPTADGVGIAETIVESEVYVTISVGANADVTTINPGGHPHQNALWRTNTVNRYTGANALATPSVLGAAANGITNYHRHVGSFRDFNVEFIYRPGTTANDVQRRTVPTIVAGWLPAPVGQQNVNRFERISERAVNPTGGSIAGHTGNTASVVFREVVPNSAWAAHNLTFTLLDEHGNPHPFATIHSVNFETTALGIAVNDTTFPHRVNNTFVNANILNPTTPGDTSVTFGFDGRTVNLAGLRLHHHYANQGRIQVTANFWITADVNFEGAVYVAVTNMGQALHNNFQLIDVEPLLIANVRRGIYIETTPNTVQVGFQSVDVSDITIFESRPGDFRPGTTIEVSLGEYGVGHVAGQSNLMFTPIPTLAADRHMTVGGAVNAASRATARLQAFHQVRGYLTINILQATRGAEPSYIRLTGLQVRAIRDVPFGSYELVIRGDSVLDNENFTGNLNMVGNVALRPGQDNFRRYPHGPLMMENYIVVATPGAGAGTGIHPEVTVFWQDGSSYVVVNGITQPLLNEAGVPVQLRNIGGRLFAPMRAITELLDGVIGWVPDARGPGQHEVEVFIGGRTVSFWRDYAYHQIWGGTRRPNVPGENVQVILIDGTHMLPIRGIINAFDLDYTDDPVTGSTTINPRR
jgi:hypothetical protein